MGRSKSFGGVPIAGGPGSAELSIGIDGDPDVVYTPDGVDRHIRFVTTKVTTGSTDGNPGYLSDKLQSLDGSVGIYEDTNTKKMNLKATHSGKVLSNGVDSAPGYLKDKIESSDGSISISENIGDGKLDLKAIAAPGDGKVLTSNSDGDRGFLVDKIVAGTGIDAYVAMNGPTNKQLVISATGGGAGNGKVLTDATDSTEDFLDDKIRIAPGSNLQKTVVDVSGKKHIQLDVLHDSNDDPLIEIISSSYVNGLLSFAGSIWDSSGHEWGGTNQNVEVAQFRVTAKSRGTLQSVAVIVSGTVQSYGAMRIALIDCDTSTVLGTTAFTDVTTIGRKAFTLTPEPGQSLTITQSKEYYIQIVARGVELSAFVASQERNNFVHDVTLRFSVRTTVSNNCDWVPCADAGFVQCLARPALIMTMLE